jgi:uncharacterized repeat protein (TIGR01451 family)
LQQRNKQSLWILESGQSPADLNPVCNYFSKILFLLTLFVASLIGQLTAQATPFTTTVPGTSIVLPTSYPQAGGVVIVLVGVNGNVYYQYSNPSVMYQGYNNSGTPAAWQGNPMQIAPVTTINCGLQSCSSYFGGGIASMSVRFTAYDGDTKAGEFDFNKITLGINGTNIGNFSAVATQTTNTAGTTLVASGTGFGNNTFDTGWFQSSDATLLANILTTGTLKSTLTDATPNDNYWDFKQGADATVGTPTIIAPGVTLKKTSTSTTFAAVGDVIPYKYVLTNIGSVWINPLKVTDNKIATVTCGAPVPPNAVVAQVDPNAVVTCTANYTVTQADLDAGKVTNVATSAGTPQYATLGSVQDTVTVTGPTRTSGVALTKAVGSVIADTNGNGKVDLGDTLNYTLVVANTGNVTLTNVTVTDPNAVVTGSPLASLAPSSTSSAITAKHILTQADVDAGVVNNQATVSATPPTGMPGPITDLSDPASNTGNAITTKPIPRTTGIALVKTAGAITDTNGNGVQDAGDTLAYTFSVTNTGTVTLTAVSVTDPIAAITGGPLASLAPGVTNSTTFAGTHVLTQTEINAGSVVNQATVTGTPPIGVAGPVTDLSGATNTDDVKTTKPLTRISTLFLDKTSPTVNYNAVGNTISYKFLVKNTGNTTLTGITIADTYPGIVFTGGPLASLAPGASDTLTFTATYAAKQTDIDTGSIVNTATASATSPTGAITSNVDSVTIPAVKAAAMTVGKSTLAPVTSIIVGQTIDYRYLITNTGNTTLTAPFTITDNRVSAGNLNCPIGNIAPLGTKTCTGVYTVTAADVALGSITNNATASNGTTTSPQVSLTIPQGATPNLTLVKTASPATFANVGDTIIYTYNVTNAGTTQFLNPVTISDNKIVGAFTCFTPVTPNFFLPTTTFSCTHNYTVTQADLDRGFVTNQASASTTGAGGVLVTSLPANATVNAVQTSTLLTTKSVSPATLTTAGTVLNYTIVVKNTGNTTMSVVTLTDPKIPTLTCTKALPTTLAPINGVTPGESFSCTGTYTATQSDIDAGVLLNTATAKGNTPQGTLVTTTGTASPTITQTPTIGLIKSQGVLIDANGNGRADAGEKLSYAMKVTNTGNVTLTAVTVADVTATVSGGPLASLAPGGVDSTTFTAVHTLTQTEIDAGSNSNQATVQATAPGGVAGAVIDSSDESTNGSAAGSNDATLTPLTKSSTLTVLKTLTSQSTTPIAVGTDLFYNVMATNTGNTTQNSVLVSDPNLVSASSNTCATVLPAGTCVLVGKHTVTQTDVNAGKFVNTAGASSTQVVTPVTSTVTTNIPQSSAITLVKSITSVTDNAPAGDSAGDVINYSLTVTNTGNVTLTGVAVTDANAVVVGGTVGILSPGAGNAVTLSATHIITQAEIDAGSVVNSAKTSGAPPTGPPVNDISGTTATDDVPTVKTFATSSSIALTKVTIPPDLSKPFIDADGSASVTLGDTLKYTVSVTNTGSTTQHDVTITDALLGLNNVLQCANLAPAAVCTVTGTYAVTQADVDAGKVDNFATVVTNEIPAVTNCGSTPCVSTPITQTHTVVLEKSLTGIKPLNGINPVPTSVSFVQIGDQLNYSFVVTNNGNTTKAGMQITDPLVPSYTCVVPTLAPGASYSLCPALSYSILQSDLNFGLVTNTAVAKIGANIVATSNVVVVPAVQNPKMSVVKIAKPVPVSIHNNDVITYEYTITNDGNVTLNGPFAVTDNRIAAANLSCPATPASIAPLGQLTCTGTYTITPDDVAFGEVTNTATISNGQTTTPPDSVTIPQGANASLAISKSIDISSVIQTPAGFSSVGDVVTYRYDVTNNGNVDFARPINVNDDKIGIFECIPSSTLVPFISSATKSCTHTYTVTLADLDRGFVLNQAVAETKYSAANTPIASTSSSQNVPAAQNPKLKTTKTLTLVNGVTPNATLPKLGDILTYTVNIANVGNVTASNITVIDAKIPSLTCTSTTLAPPDAMDCNGTYVVTQADIDAGSIANTAITNAVAPLGGAIPQTSDTISTTLTPADPKISIVKSSNFSGFTDNNQGIDYFFEVKNEGNVTLTNVTVTDTLTTPAFTCTIPKLIPGQIDSNSCVMHYVVTQADIDAGGITNTAQVTATPARGVLPPVDSNTIILNGPAREPSMKVVKSTVSTPTKAGDTLDYVFSVANTGNVTINSIVLSDAKCDPLHPITLQSEDILSDTILQVREIQIYTCTSIPVTQLEIDAGQVNNTVTVAGTPSGGTFTSPTTMTLSTPVVQAPSLTLVKSAGSPTVNKGLLPTVTDKGDEIAYTFTIHNTGNVTLNTLTVTDAKITSVTCPTTPLAPGLSADCTATYPITQADLDAGKVLNTATGSGTPPATTANPSPTPVSDTSGTTETNDTQTEVLLTATPKWTVNKKTVSVPTKAGDTLAYTFDVANTGNVTITSFAVTDPKCAATPIYVSGDAGTIGALDAGEKQTYSCTSIAVTQSQIDAGKVDNTATASGTAAGGTLTDAKGLLSTPVTPAPAWTVTKKTVSIPTKAGDTLAYTFDVANTGNVTITSFAVTDPKCAATPIYVSGDAGTIGALDAGETQTYSCTSIAVTQSQIDAGKVDNTATASGTAAGGTLTDAKGLLSTPVTPAPAWTVTKKTSSVPTKAGDTLAYTFDVANTGNVTITSFAVTDPKCAATPIYVSGDAGTIGALDAGETQIYSCTSIAVTQSQIDAGKVDNTATASGTAAGGTLADAKGLLSTPVTALGRMEVVKSADLSAVSIPPVKNDIITYHFAVTNTGNVTLTSLAVNDLKVSPITCPVTTLLPAASTDCTGDYVLTQADIDLGTVTNTATGSALDPKLNPITDISGTAPGPSNNTQTVTPLSPLGQMAVLKSANTSALSAPPKTGDIISYVMTVQNTGNVTLKSVNLTDTLKNAAGATLPLGSGPTLTGGDLGVVGSLEVGETWIYAATYTLKQADIDAGGVNNSLVVNAVDPHAGPVTGLSDDPATAAPNDATTTTFASGPAIALLKHIKSVNDVNGNGITDIGDTVTYSFDVTNTGNVTLSNIHLTDTMITNLFVPIKSLTVTGGPITLAPNAKDLTTFKVVYPITQSDIDLGYVQNTATAIGTPPTGADVSDESDPNVNTGNAPTILNISPVRSLTLAKAMTGNADEDGNGFISLNDTLTYTVTATNTSNVTLQNLVVTDTKLSPATTATCVTVAPLGTCVLIGTYQVTAADVAAGVVLNSATAVADLLATTVRQNISTPVASAIAATQFTKVALKTDVHRGETVPYVITITKVPLNPVRVVDLIPPGFTYVAGSAIVNGAVIAPVITPTTLTFDGLAPDANGIIKINLSLLATASAQTGPAINRAQLVNPTTGVVLATAQATVRIAPEHVFDCGEIIGKVFDDKNRNGYQDEGEPGLPGVRLTTVKGLLITTDKFGRFHIACADIPDADIGSNFVLKLDTRTLPTGYRVTTENPRDIRLTRGKITKLNFGAAITRVVKVDLNGKVFKKGSTELLDAWLLQIDPLINTLTKEPSVLRLNYYTTGEGNTLAAKRIAEIEKLIAKKWVETGERYKLPIESRVLGVEGAPSK